jgi:hypothetical protein
VGRDQDALEDRAGADGLILRSVSSRAAFDPSAVRSKLGVESLVRLAPAHASDLGENR